MKTISLSVLNIVQILISLGFLNTATAGENLEYPDKVGQEINVPKTVLATTNSNIGNGKVLAFGALGVTSSEGRCAAMAGRWEGYLEDSPVAKDIKIVAFLDQVSDDEVSIAAELGADLHYPFLARTFRLKHDSRCTYSAPSVGESRQGKEDGTIFLAYDENAKSLRLAGNFSRTERYVLTQSKTFAIYSDLKSHLSQRGITSGEFDGLPSGHVGNQYLIYTPRQASGDVKKPLIIFLHGWGDIGDSPEILYKASPLRYIADGGELDTYILAPQHRVFPSGGVSTDWLDGVLEAALKKWPIDNKRIYLIGLSLGAYQAWQWAIERPNTFAAFVSISMGDPEYNSKAALDGFVPFGNYGHLKGLRIKGYHGQNDSIVPVDTARKTWRRAIRAGAKVESTVYQNGDHDAWSRPFADPGFFRWLLAQRLGN